MISASFDAWLRASSISQPKTRIVIRYRRRKDTNGILPQPDHPSKPQVNTTVTSSGAVQDFQTGKDAFGLDHSQARTQPALLRHLVLAMAALAVCAITAANARTTTTGTAPPPTRPDDIPPADPGLISLTVTEVKRLINLLTRSWHGLQHHLHWHIWRRRHQARARWFHQRMRLARR